MKTNGPFRRATGRTGRVRRAPPSLESLESRQLLSVLLHETEPNDTTMHADRVNRLLDETVIVSGRVGDPSDRDWFAIDLEAGDIVGSAVRGKGPLNAEIRLINPAGELMISNDDSDRFGATYLPPESRLPRVHSARDSEIYYVISAPGTYYVGVSASAEASSGMYEMEWLVSRPTLEKQPVGATQILFLDFDGAGVDFSTYTSEKTHKTKTLAPLSEALPEWGLTAADEDALIDAILAEVTGTLSTYVATNGRNGDFASTGIPGQFGIEIRNSRVDVDEFGSNPLVSGVVVGLIRDPKFSAVTVGTAESIDVGNFKTDDEAVATLDLYAGLLDRYPIVPPATVIDALSVGIGSNVSHEAGHIFGCWHTEQTEDQFAGTPSLMDPGNLILLGPDEIFGTSDDVDLPFAVDEYYRGDVYRGLNDTLNTVAFGLSTGTRRASSTESARRGTANDLGLARSATPASDATLAFDPAPSFPRPEPPVALSEPDRLVPRVVPVRRSRAVVLDLAVEDGGVAQDIEATVAIHVMQAGRRVRRVRRPGSRTIAFSDP